MSRTDRTEVKDGFLVKEVVDSTGLRQADTINFKNLKAKCFDWNGGQREKLKITGTVLSDQRKKISKNKTGMGIRDGKNVRLLWDIICIFLLGPYVDG